MERTRELKTEEAYCEDNYGTWEDTQDPRVVDLYEEVKSKSEFKKCIRCGTSVWLLSYRNICSSCVENILEQIQNSPCVKSVYEQQLFYTGISLISRAHRDSEAKKLLDGLNEAMDKFDAPLVKRFCSIDESGENEDEIPLTYAEQMFSSDNMEDNLWRYALYIGGSLYRPADKVETYIKRRDAGDRNTCMITVDSIFSFIDLEPDGPPARRAYGSESAW